MTFEEWWEEDHVGLSREEELRRALYVDEWRVTRMMAQAYEAGREAGYDTAVDDMENAPSRFDGRQTF